MTIEAAHYGEEVRALMADPIVVALAESVPVAERSKMLHEDGSPRWEFMKAANAEYTKRGGKAGESIGGVPKAVAALWATSA